MMKITGRPRRRQNEDGAVVVEFAIVFVLFMLLIWGLMTYGMIFAAQQTVTHAAAEAARASVSQATEQDAQNVANFIAAEQLAWLVDGPGLAPVSGGLQIADCPPPADGRQCVFVEYQYPWGTHPKLPALFGIGVPDTLTGTAVVTWEGP